MHTWITMLPQCHAIPFINHSYWHLYLRTQHTPWCFPFTEAIQNACSRNWLRSSPWSNVVLAKIPKAFRQSGRGRLGGVGVGDASAFCTLPVRKSVRVEIEDLDKQLSALPLTVLGKGKAGYWINIHTINYIHL